MCCFGIWGVPGELSDSLKHIAHSPLSHLSAFFFISTLTSSIPTNRHLYSSRLKYVTRICFLKALPHWTTIPFCFVIASMPLTLFYLASANPCSVFSSTASPGVTGLAAYSWKWTEILLREHFASRSEGERRKPWQWSWQTVQPRVSNSCCTLSHLHTQNTYHVLYTMHAICDTQKHVWAHIVGRQVGRCTCMWCVSVRLSMWDYHQVKQMAGYRQVANCLRKHKIENISKVSILVNKWWERTKSKLEILLNLQEL